MESSAEVVLIGERSEAEEVDFSGVRVRSVERAVVVVGFRGLKVKGSLEKGKRAFVGFPRFDDVREERTTLRRWIKDRYVYMEYQ
ncbi:hypothetical protein GH714_005586 [Hevea brasiliensis]|uniref:Uncharacterized protein n=1 Tax=Hevea brasiliensis TaxID=3981 RepID=A0A6A6N763_HEVBR|nr:hypothetical protein GH714_005586 [Hevea brasiliensis]